MELIRNASIRKRLFTGIGLQALQQLTGVNFIFYYGTSYFSNSGISNAFVVTMITSVVNVVGTVPGLILVEKWGRRPLLMCGAIGMSVCQMIVASVGTARPHDSSTSKALIAFVCFYIMFFASTWGPCAWVVTGEIFPLKARAKGLSITTSSNWLLNWAIAYATPYLVNSGAGNSNLGSKVFFIWGGFCVVCMAFVHLCIYETKGLSLEQVDELYAKVDKAWQSKGFVPTLHFQDLQGYGSEEARTHGLAHLEEVAGRRKESVADIAQEKA
jgi:sugar porter (SP) family MFS transporter